MTVGRCIAGYEMVLSMCPRAKLDVFDGMVVSWSIGTSPDAELVNTMLDAAIETVTEDDETPIVHSGVATTAGLAGCRGLRRLD
ncbi:protein of unknown function [Paraburkholderia kururiensis]